MNTIRIRLAVLALAAYFQMSPASAIDIPPVPSSPGASEFTIPTFKTAEAKLISDAAVLTIIAIVHPPTMESLQKMALSSERGSGPDFAKWKIAASLLTRAALISAMAEDEPKYVATLEAVKRDEERLAILNDATLRRFADANPDFKRLMYATEKISGPDDREKAIQMHDLVAMVIAIDALKRDDTKVALRRIVPTSSPADPSLAAIANRNPSIWNQWRDAQFERALVGLTPYYMVKSTLPILDTKSALVIANILPESWIVSRQDDASGRTKLPSGCLEAAIAEIQQNIGVGSTVMAAVDLATTGGTFTAIGVMIDGAWGCSKAIAGNARLR